MSGGVIDPADSAPLALRGRIVTLDAAGSVLDDGVVYVRDGSIAAVLPASVPAPAGFDRLDVQAVRGTVMPGLIELHNHLSYDVLRLWQVPRLYANRDTWSGSSTPDYHRLISGPMGVLGRNRDVVPAIVRYVEVRALLGGTTTSQGIALASNAGIVTHYRGLVRNVESTRDPDLPPAATHIADVDAVDAEHFLARISGTQKLILHLSEGTNDAARQHFLALHLADGRWAITPNLIGIHCVGLRPVDFTVLAGHGGSMVWSPLSNLLLYGKTANLGAALQAGVPVALGSDWSPSGSKNLLGELKIAQLAAPDAGATLTAQDVVRMATTVPARLLGWDAHLGSLEAGKRADLLVVAGTSGNPYQRLIDATEADLRLVMINGVARVGTPALMAHLGGTTETITVGGRRRLVNLAQPTADADVATVSIAQAIDTLREALASLPTTSTAPPPPAGRMTRAAIRAEADDQRPMLAVAGVIDNHMSPRPHLPYRGKLTGPNLPTAAFSAPAARAAAAAPEPLPALHLDPLAAVDNPAYYQQLSTEMNIPAAIRAAIAAAGAP